MRAAGGGGAVGGTRLAAGGAAGRGEGTNAGCGRRADTVNGAGAGSGSGSRRRRQGSLSQSRGRRDESSSSSSDVGEWWKTLGPRAVCARHKGTRALSRLGGYLRRTMRLQRTQYIRMLRATNRLPVSVARPSDGGWRVAGRCEEPLTHSRASQGEGEGEGEARRRRSAAPRSEELPACGGSLSNCADAPTSELALENRLQRRTSEPLPSWAGVGARPSSADHRFRPRLPPTPAASSTRPKRLR